MDFSEAKSQLDKVIKKSRVHLYKPIQIAEILYRHRTVGDIDLANLESYRTKSRRWRDIICIQFLGRVSTSSARFQDNLFEKNAVPPAALLALAEQNLSGEVEAYTYHTFKERYSQMSQGLDLVRSSNKDTFQLKDFIDGFRKVPGLARSIDKVFEIIVYAIFSSILDSLDVTIGLKINNPNDKILDEFSDFTEKILRLNLNVREINERPHIYRVGVTNAADRGLDMWANFGLAIQIKHISLTPEIATDIASGISADRMVIVCKDCDKTTVMSVLSQMGQNSKIQAIITEDELSIWYEKGLRGSCSEMLGDLILQRLANEIMAEFPITDRQEFQAFWDERGYQVPSQSFGKS